ncbi:SDR family NAD(P)-dependent oxidoreductase [Candidatus Woesearchaeota archaeon]|nr:SDR family NAD(P)-dependent oxidoreductase [Candidatus Woesearchaeota archaeon]
MKILVTGGAGFIGYHVSKALLERGDEVVIVDNMNDYYDVQIKKDRLKDLGSNITFYKLDISNYEALDIVFQHHNFDKVCHLAAQAGVRYSIENPHAYEMANGLGTLNVLECMRHHNVKDLVFASSSSVYGGNTITPFSVEHNVDSPISLYAASKKYNELKAHVYHKLYGLNCIGLRFFTVYGNMGRPDMALYKFTKSILENKPIDVFNNGEHERDFTHVSDITQGILLALNQVPLHGFQILNLGNNDTIHLIDFIGHIENAIGKTAEKNMLPMQKGDVYKTYADIEKTKQILGWEPKTRIEEGVNQFVLWYREYHNI